MKWIVGCFLTGIMYSACIISKQCSDEEEQRKIEDMIHKLEKE